MGLAHLRPRLEAPPAVKAPAASIPAAVALLLRVAVPVALLLSGSSPAAAHQEPYSYLDIHLEPQGLSGKLVAHVVDLAHEAGLEVPDSLFDRGFVAARLPELHAVLASHLVLLADGVAVRAEWRSFEIVRERRSVAFEWQAALPHPPGVLEVRGPLFPYDPPHETYLNIYERGSLASQDLLDRSHRDAIYCSGSTQGTLAVVRTFVFEGIHHIFIGPDHVLFIVGLLLLGGGLLRLLKIVTAFTVAHTVTLVLATLRVVSPPPRLIEPAIALSIVTVGVETLLALRRKRDWRAPIAFGFGFVHGFGFASVLREFGLPSGALGWSLASFNVGVELGQAAIVLAVAPALERLRSARPWVARRVVAAGAVTIVAAGGYWLVQRLMFTT